MAFLISRSRRRCALRLAMARQGLTSQLRQVSRSGTVTPGLAEVETMEMSLRRSNGEIFSGCRALGSAGEVASFSKAPYEPYEAPYNAKPSIKHVNVDDQGPVFRRSARVIVGVIAGGDFTSVKSSLGALARFSCVMLLLSRKETPFSDPDEFNIRCSHKLLPEERYLPRRPGRRELPPSWCRSPRSPTSRADEQTIVFSAPHRRG
jgi:hypothetical protein